MVRNDLIQQMAQSLALTIADSANTDTNIPNYNGDSGKVQFHSFLLETTRPLSLGIFALPLQVSYTLSSFRFTLDLENYYYTAASPTYTFGWQSTGFVLTFNYHMCLHVIFHPCESGNVQITTTKAVNLQVDASMDFSGAALNFLAQNVQLLFNRGDINIYVHCSNAICVIPPSDVANAIAQAFVPAFVGGIKTSINTVRESFCRLHRS